MSGPTLNPLSLEGRRILVTGASSGLGRATAILASRLGATVVCNGRDGQRLEQTLHQLEGTGHSAQPFDLKAVDGIAAWLESIATSVGPLHGLVHAAGVQSVLPLHLASPARWKDALLVNVETAIALAKAFQGRRVYAGDHGSMVFLSSVMGQVGAPGRVLYSLGKGAVEAMMRSLALELAPRKIRVNCVAPAFVKTAMLDEMAKVWTDEQRTQVERLHPLGLGEPDDVAGAVAFLLADTGRWVTGTVLRVDGGYSAQ
jgi:NAD(P)-dependent dehydrogenase (short-subunit alcohol dehydrogenase family)